MNPRNVPPVRTSTAPSIDEIFQTLRERRLSYPAIAESCNLFLGTRLTSEQVRWRLRAMGEPPRKGPNGVPLSGRPDKRTAVR